MHRLLLTAAVLSLTAAPAEAQPPWPATTSQPSAGPSASPLAEAPRRITPRPASGQTAATPGRSPAARGVPSPWTAFGSLAVIVGLIVVAARVWKTHGPPIGGGLPSDALEILGRRPLDRRNAIQIVRCGSRILILGVGEDGLRTLAEISDPAEVESLTGICRREASDQEGGPGVLGFLRRPHAASTLEGPQFRGRIDEVLAHRFPQPGPAIGTPGSPAHA